MVSIAPTQSNVQAAMKAFLTAILPTTGSDGKAVSIIAAQQNRVPEPTGADFVIMTPIRFERIETNVDSYLDVKFIGSISGAVLTVASVTIGVVAPGNLIFGTGVVTGTAVGTQISGAPGGPGTYAVSPSQSAAEQTLSAGTETLQQAAKVTLQLDFHGGNDTIASDMAQTFKTIFRDGYAVNFFAALPAGQNGAVPLYAEDPRMTPFLNDQQQYEWRWVIDAYLQINQIVSVPQQYYDLGAVTLIDVDAAYPPS